MDTKPRMPRADRARTDYGAAVCTLCDAADTLGCHPTEVCTRLEALLADREAELREAFAIGRKYQISLLHESPMTGIYVHDLTVLIMRHELSKSE